MKNIKKCTVRCTGCWEPFGREGSELVDANFSVTLQKGNAKPKVFTFGIIAEDIPSDIECMRRVLAPHIFKRWKAFLVN